MQSESLTGESFEQALNAGALTRRTITLVGLAKPSEADAHICFTTGGCDAWVELPTEMIERAEPIGQGACGDHSHPLVRLALSEPTTPEGKLLAALLTPSIPIPPPLGALATPSIPIPPPLAAAGPAALPASVAAQALVGGQQSPGAGGGPIIVDNCRPSFCPRIKLVRWADGSLVWVYVWEPCLDCSPIQA